MSNLLIGYEIHGYHPQNIKQLGFFSGCLAAICTCFSLVPLETHMAFFVAPQINLNMIDGDQEDTGHLQSFFLNFVDKTRVTMGFFPDRELEHEFYFSICWEFHHPN